MSQDSKLTGNSNYYSARAVEERRLAMTAKDPNARAIHLEMAEEYARRAENGREAEDSTEQPRHAG